MITLVLGGTRSGKSAVAESLVAEGGGEVVYVATAAVDPEDADHRARIGRHQARRPAGWRTVECDRPGDLVATLASHDGPILVDSLGSWVAAHDDLVVDGEGLTAVLAARGAPTVVVSEEVGLAVHPPTEIGRRYVDALGTLNQQVSAVADRVLFVVAGRVLELPC